MTPTILKAIERSSPSEVILPPEFIEADVIKVLAELRPDMESLTIEYPDNEALKYLSLFPKLRKLFIKTATCLSRDGSWLHYVCLLTQLTHIAINSYEDIDLPFLHNLCNLENLISIDLGCSDRIHDEYLSVFKNFKNLRFLNLNSADYLTDVGIDEITTLIDLEGLEIVYAKSVTEKGLRSISSLNNLRYLDLSETHISNDGLKSFFALDRLKFLNLEGCLNITSEGLIILTQLSNLRQIYIADSFHIPEKINQQIPSSLQIIQVKEAWKLWNLKVKEFR